MRLARYIPDCERELLLTELTYLVLHGKRHCYPTRGTVLTRHGEATSDWSHGPIYRFWGLISHYELNINRKAKSELAADCKQHKHDSAVDVDLSALHRLLRCRHERWALRRRSRIRR